MALTFEQALDALGLASFPGARETRIAYFRTVRAEKDGSSERLAHLGEAFDTIKISREARGLFGLQSNVHLMMSLVGSDGLESEALDLLAEFEEDQEEECLSALRRGVAEGRPGYLEVLGEMFAERLSDEELELLQGVGGVWGPIYSADAFLVREDPRAGKSLLRALRIAEESHELDYPDPVWAILAVRQLAAWGRTDDAQAIADHLDQRLARLIDTLTEEGEAEGLSS